MLAQGIRPHTIAAVAQGAVIPLGITEINRCWAVGTLGVVTQHIAADRGVICAEHGAVIPRGRHIVDNLDIQARAVAITIAVRSQHGERLNMVIGAIACRVIACVKQRIGVVHNAGTQIDTGNGQRTLWRRNSWQAGHQRTGSNHRHAIDG